MNDRPSFIDDSGEGGSGGGGSGWDDSGRYYRLIGKRPVRCGLRAWANWFGNRRQRQIARTLVGPYFVSTVFLGLDQNFWGEGPPVLFETMAFLGGDGDSWSERACSWGGAIRAHQQTCRWARRKTRHARPLQLLHIQRRRQFRASVARMGQKRAWRLPPNPVSIWLRPR